ncbi:hypothetical protein GCK72_011134 [Caenorhabditis remanei]|uniref:SPK domain-containing protein n=1 Tax=Caenorhabditis remanei TaxID=31234 RepID=A0A6A5H7N2_CAERE|nr:hypothetical protein GCK72_011134 [Caenorhabditis remanei]KAF1762871.1 hypothetical protein GCK72_011134 [Caenorhabditis remanei]
MASSRPKRQPKPVKRDEFISIRLDSQSDDDDFEDVPTSSCSSSSPPSRSKRAYMKRVIQKKDEVSARKSLEYFTPEESQSIFHFILSLCRSKNPLREGRVAKRRVELNSRDLWEKCRELTGSSRDSHAHKQHFMHFCRKLHEYPNLTLEEKVDLYYALDIRVVDASLREKLIEKFEVEFNETGIITGSLLLHHWDIVHPDSENEEEEEEAESNKSMKFTEFDDGMMWQFIVDQIKTGEILTNSKKFWEEFRKKHEKKTGGHRVPETYKARYLRILLPNLHRMPFDIETKAALYFHLEYAVPEEFRKELSDRVNVKLDEEGMISEYPLCPNPIVLQSRPYKSIIGISSINKLSTLKPPNTSNDTRPYSTEEDGQMWQYILYRSNGKRINQKMNGWVFWKQFMSHVHTDRSWQSLSEHFVEDLMENIQYLPYDKKTKMELYFALNHPVEDEVLAEFESVASVVLTRTRSIKFAAGNGFSIGRRGRNGGDESVDEGIHLSEKTRRQNTNLLNQMHEMAKKRERIEATASNSDRFPYLPQGIRPRVKYIRKRDRIAAAKRAEKAASLAAKQSPNEPPPYFPNEKLRYQYFTELEYGKRVEDHRRRKRIAEKEEDSENNEDAETEVKLEPMDFVSEDLEIDEKPTRDEPTSFERILEAPLNSGAQEEQKPEKLSVTSPPKIQEKEQKPERFEDSGVLKQAMTVPKMSKPTQLIVKTIRERVPYYPEIGDSEAPTTIPQTVFRKFKTDHNKVPAYFEQVRPSRTVETVPYVAYDHPALDVVTEQKPERFEDSGALTLASTVPKTTLVRERVPYYPRIGDSDVPTTSEAPKIPRQVLRPPEIGTRIDPPRKPVPYYCRKVYGTPAKKPKLTKVSGVDAKTLYVAMGGAPKPVPYYSEEEEEEGEMDFEPRISEYDLSSEIQKQPERVPYFPEAREKDEHEEAEPVESEPEEYVYDKTPFPSPANRQVPPLYVGKRFIARKAVAEQLTATTKSANPPRYASFLQKKQFASVAPRQPIPVATMNTFDSMDSGIESNGWVEKEPKKEFIVLRGGWNGETMDTMNTSSSGFLTRPSSKPSKVMLTMELFNNQKHVPTTTPIKEPSRPHSDEFVDSAIEEMEIHLKTFSKEFSDANSKLTPAQRQMYGDRLLGSVKMFQAGIKKAIMKDPPI